jgi:hypothetical protein
MINREIVHKIVHCNTKQYPQVLEQKFPHVLEKIVTLWDSSEEEDYLNDLLQTNGRGGGRFDRDGFPEDAWDEILNLKMLHDSHRDKFSEQ